MESQAATVLGDTFYDDPSQLSQALRQRAGSGDPLRFTTSTESPSGILASASTTPAPPPANCNAPPLPFTAPAKATCAPSTRRVETVKYVKPTLPKQHSAPTSAGMVVELEGALKMHRSFGGMDAPGDTQPDSQMLKDFTSGNFPALDVDLLDRGPKSLFIEHEDEDEDEDEEDDDLPTDLSQSSQQHNRIAVTSPTVVDADDPMHAEPHSLALTSPLKFETPALAGRMRDASAQVLSSAARTSVTPGTVASAFAFGLGFGNGQLAGGPVMSLTQAWHNTQAPTSPAVGRASEDAVFTRPSPNFSNVRHSSPMPVFSSPIKSARPETPWSEPVIRSSSEPRAEYVTMEESQEKRGSTAGDENHSAAEHDSWNDLSRHVRARIAKQEFHRKAARSLSHISAPAPQSKKNRNVNERHSLSTKPRTPRNRARLRAPDEEDQEKEEEDSIDELSQHKLVKDKARENLLDESSPYVPNTDKATVKQQRDMHNIQVPKTSSHPRQTPSGRTSPEYSPQPSPPSRLHRESQVLAARPLQVFESAFQPRSSRDSVAVLDSQPDTTTNFESISQPKSIRLPSSPSANQYSINQTTMATRTGYTSQVISSSMPPMPPKSSTQNTIPRADVEAAEDDRVPSSPPLLAGENDPAHENNLEYDEHTYDEYAGGEVNEETASRSALEEDGILHEDDDLPVTKPTFDNNSADDLQAKNTEDESDSELIQPQKVDLGTDQEIPETLDQRQQDGNSDYEGPIEGSSHSNPIKPTQKRNQLDRKTVPETGILDETQPSFFPGDISRDAPNQTNSTEAFQTAREELSVSQNNAIVPGSSKDDGSDTMRAPDRIQSLSDIHNLPETQQSHAEEEIEMPRLSGLDEDETALGFSPKPPPAKRRKVTYAAKRSAFRSPLKSNSDTDSLSDPPPSPGLEPLQALPGATFAQTSGHVDSLEDASNEENPTRYTRPAVRKSSSSRKRSKHLSQKTGALKPVKRELLQSLSSPANSPRKSKAATPTTPSRSRREPRAPKIDVHMPDAGSEINEPAGPTGPAPQTADDEVLFEGLSTDGEIPAGNVPVPNRVFASWPGSHYFPATCIGRSTLRQLRIRFDDGNVTSLDAAQVRALDLRRGDHVKVDEKGMKKHTYVVVGLKDRIDDLEGEEFPTTDRLGFATVVLEEKRNDSLQQVTTLPASEHISVPIASIYLPTGLWTRLRDRPFNFSPLGSPTKSMSGIGTPVTESLALGSFARRSTAVPSLLKDVTFRAGSVASTAQAVTETFSKMAFVLTSTTADIDKDAIAKNIQRHGGLVLELGFHELFDYEAAELSPSQSRRRSVSSLGEPLGMMPKHAYRDIGFVALISDAHSRSTKYIQALALNVPCLHLRWINDSLSASRALPFSRYLLPAGVSKFLDPNGVIRSRTMSIYDPASEDVTFTQTIQSRDLLLHDQSVLLITGKSKKEIERRQPFVFLTHALGSANVGQCADLATAATLLREGQWDWVYVDSGDKGLAEAAAELFAAAGRSAHGGKSKKSKKRKREESEEKEEMVARGEVNGRRVRIASSEFVIQSLILGALVEE